MERSMPSSDERSLLSSSIERTLTRVSQFNSSTPQRSRRHLQVSYSTLSTEAIADVGIKEYGFAEPLECLLFQRGMNDTYFLSTPNGQYALRVARSNVRKQAVLLGELATLQHVSLKDVGAPLPVARKDGGWVTEIEAPEGSRSAVVFNWIPGRAPRWTDPQHAAQYGRAVARLHDATDDLVDTQALPQMDTSYLLDSPCEIIRRRVTKFPATLASLTELADRTRRRLTQATRTLKDWGLCHGDVHANNARIEDGSLVLLDFDCCALGWRLYDLASYRCEARRQGVEEAAWRPFIEGYLELRPTARDSLEFVGTFMILRHLWMTAQCSILCAEMGRTFLPDESFESLMPFCEQVEREVD